MENNQRDRRLRLARPNDESVISRPVYTGRVRSIARIGRYYYGYAIDENGLYLVCMQKIGDIGWFITENEFTSLPAVIERIKYIEKEHYGAINDKTHP